jgi:hypothetical protein
LHADLVGQGYDGFYNRVAAFARESRTVRHREQQTTGRGACVLLALSPDEAFQFDWSEDWAIIPGERTKLQVAYVKITYSRAFILRAYSQKSNEILFDANIYVSISVQKFPGNSVKKFLLFHPDLVT